MSSQGGGGVPQNMVLYALPCTVLWQGAIASVTIANSDSVAYSASSAWTFFQGSPPYAVMETTLTPHSATLLPAGTSEIASQGDLAYQAATAQPMFAGSAAAFVSATPAVANIFFRTGPVSALPPGWPEGAPYEAGIVNGDSCFEMLFLGGHDGQNKIVGGGFQTCSGQPAWTPNPDGSWVPAVFDATNLKLWVFSGGAWHYLSFT